MFDKIITSDEVKFNDLERYQDLAEVPKAPEGIEYRNMGTQESQIFSMCFK